MLIPGKNTITIRVDNRVKDIDPGHNSHSISDHTQTNWNGITGDISLHAKGEIFFDNIEVYPDAEKKAVSVRAVIINTLFSQQQIDVPVSVRLKDSSGKVLEEKFPFSLMPGENIVRINFSLGEEALLWDEFNRNVYEFTAEIKNKKITDRRSVDFGLRDFKVDGTRFSVNGRPVFLRGTLECAIFPKTGYPPTEVQDWEKVYKAVKDHGLNHVRFHSWCPPKAAFVAADKMGSLFAGGMFIVGQPEHAAGEWDCPSTAISMMKAGAL
jgi:beta-galactosidase/beta-glucuronidase